MWEDGLGRFNTLQRSFGEDLVSLVIEQASLAVGGDSQTILSVRRRCSGVRCTGFPSLPGNLFPLPSPGLVTQTWIRRGVRLGFCWRLAC